MSRGIFPTVSSLFVGRISWKSVGDPLVFFSEGPFVTSSPSTIAKRCLEERSLFWVAQLMLRRYHFQAARHESLWSTFRFQHSGHGGVSVVWFLLKILKSFSVLREGLRYRRS